MNIETGIPMPPPANRGRGRSSVFTKLIRALAVDQSVFLESEKQLDHAHKVVRSMGWRYEQRKMDGGWRIWRRA